jgi:hypothetical protein
MTQSQHTPGPWYAHTTFISGETDNIAIAQCSYRGEVDLDEAMANARLIAAAPEMLEAATNLMAQIQRTHPGLYACDLAHDLRNAINKSKGGTL